ncbi:MAG TPA: hypothetical protein VHA15_05485 [Burkholderiales bacterium]|nr:hypothetical protein [Burkholderiales bacterium]
MDSLSLTALAIELLASVHSMAGYSQPTHLPVIHQVPLAQIQQRFCKGPCRIQAYYLPGEGVFIDEAFDLEDSEFARSVLFHELVHHAQRTSGKFQAIPSECDRWYAAEREAYDLQNRYLEERHDAHRVNVNAWRARCDD